MSSFKPATSSEPFKKSRVADQIFMDLRDQIVSGALTKGSTLPTERALANHYGVSGPTVREAIRVLSAFGLVDVRHGSGAYVTTSTASMMAASISTVIQLEALGAEDVLSILGVLNEHVVKLACRAANAEDHARIQERVKDLARAATSQEAADAVRAFHHALASAAHNPLLSAICLFLTDIQTELGMELTGDSFSEWQQVLGKLRPVRAQMVDAIISRDENLACALARNFHASAIQLITSLPKAKEVRLTDPKLTELLSSMMSRIRPL